MINLDKTGYVFKHGLFRKYIYLIVGAILFSVGLTTILLIENISHNLCSLDTGFNVYSGPSSLVCQVKGDLEKDITFEAYFYDNRNGEHTKFPANVQIIDPNGIVLQSQNFNDKIAFTFKPMNLGNYKALITYLDNNDKTYDPVHTGINVQYGFVTGDNVLGLELTYAGLIGGISHVAGIISLVYGGIRLVRNKRKSDVTKT